MISPAILDDLTAQHDELDRRKGPLTTTIEMRWALRRQFDKLNNAFDSQGDWLLLRVRLIELAALACRALRDQGLETAGDAAGKDIPF